MASVDFLAGERRKAEFDVDAMKIAWAGSLSEFQLHDRISKLVASDPVKFPLFPFFCLCCWNLFILENGGNIL